MFLLIFIKLQLPLLKFVTDNRNEKTLVKKNNSQKDNSYNLAPYELLNNKLFITRENLLAEKN